MKMHSKLLIIIRLYSVLLFLIQYGNCAKKLPFKFMFLNATSEFNPDFIASYTATIRPKIPGTIMDLEYEVITNYTKNPMLNLTIHKMGNDKKYHSLFNIKFDYCLMAGTNEDKKSLSENVNVAAVLNVWIDNVKRHSNSPKCPVTAGRYGYQKLKPEPKSLPPFIQSGKYIIETMDYFKNPYVQIKHVQVFVELKKQSKI